MIPGLFSKLAERGRCYSKPAGKIFIFSLIGFIVSFVCVPFLQNIYAIIAVPVFATPLLLSLAFFFMTHHFSGDGKFSTATIGKITGIKKTLRVFQAWFAFIMLLVWIISAALAVANGRV